MAVRKTPTDSEITTASARDIETACQALDEIKRQTKRIARLGGGVPNAGLLLAAADDCPEAVMVTDNEAQIRMVNGSAARLTGLTTRELQSLTIWDVTHAASQVDFDILWKEFLRAGRQRGAYAFRHKNGTAVEVAYCAEANVIPQLHVFVLRKLPRP